MDSKCRLRTGSSGLAPTFAKDFKKRIEMLGEDRRCENLLAPEAVMERSFRMSMDEVISAMLTRAYLNG
jgi:hypothetical protein